MRRSQNIIMRIVCAGLALWSLYCLYSAAASLWSHLRMRSVPVEVVRSSLVMDAHVYTPGQPAEPEYTLRLDLVTTDGSARNIHWEDAPGKAVYPEEAIDEFLRWSPGTRHTISQLRGEAREIRLAGSVDWPESGAAVAYLVGAVFLAFMALLALGVSSQNDSRLRPLFGMWIGFFSVGAVATLCAVLYAAWYIPKIGSWPMVGATTQTAPESYDPAGLPANVTITPATRKRFESSQHRVITFSWNGTPIRGGIGSMDGPYDQLASSNCTAGGPPCTFWFSPTDRWDIAARLGWGPGLFIPLGFFLVFGLAFSGVGLHLRRHRF
ncbi:MAG: hypothetical protein ACKV2U_32430 [Bryobacteraceae bacterium]